ncbi:response regulator [Paeniglutamicibacter kerguelensis]|uniref:Transcriptional regulatory protein n=1 Tax=Paeniglutamicibacter kerguelensis TaxID=254788 RepID=A0ABS4XAB1_9MICC|nr:response regulator [Paeniglutamicibacter kerguelensis]MBP2385306.1 response regulator of citrate/malate metabolism [Paeniglutamicibacter kerguelensis]
MDTPNRPLRVLVVDDERTTASAHASFVSRVPGFVVHAIAHTGAEAFAELSRATAEGTPIDLVLLDMNLPDLHGLDVARRVRGKGDTVDIIAITAIRDLNVVRTAIATGVTQYLIKPFSFAAFREKLTNYREFRLNLGTGGTSASQASIDNAFAALRSVGPAPLPKGLIAETLASIEETLRSVGTALSATEVSEALDLSRVTARRYLEHLAEANKASKAPRHGTRGRPEYEYKWRRGS